MARIINARSTARGNRFGSTEGMRQQLRWVAWLLDSSIPVPGTRFTVGVDAVIGLFPFVGDLIGAALSTYILSEASRAGAPKSVLLRMAFNIALEAVVGSVPLAGDLFDAAFKANQRNVRLLEAWLDQPRRTVRATRTFAALLIVALVAFLVVLGAGIYALLSLIFQ